jgi:hypothetical protein
MIDPTPPLPISAVRTAMMFARIAANFIQTNIAVYAFGSLTNLMVWNSVNPGTRSTQFLLRIQECRVYIEEPDIVIFDDRKQYLQHYSNNRRCKANAN